MKQFWIAKWLTWNGTPKELIFASQTDHLIARVEFQLQCMERGIACPNEFELEEFRGKSEFRLPLTTPLQLVVPDGVEI
jgi:hypothetical protein